MTTENYRGFKLRYVRDGKSKGKIKVYIERGVNSRTQHYYKGKNGSPPYICFKPETKPSSLSKARPLAHKWVDECG